MTLIEATFFDPEMLKAAVLTPAQLRTFRTKARPVCGIDPDTGHSVSALLHPDGRIAITSDGKRSKADKRESKS